MRTWTYFSHIWLGSHSFNIGNIYQPIGEIVRDPAYQIRRGVYTPDHVLDSESMIHYFAPTNVGVVVIYDAHKYWLQDKYIEK